MDGDPDESLVERCREGDGSAFAALVGRYHRPIYNAAFRVLGNAEDASDITQVVFMKVTERLDDFDSRYKFFSWIYRIALNESLNLARKRSREEPLDEDFDAAGSRSAEPEWNAGQSELEERVQRALLGMNVDDRAVLTLRHFSDCSYREMSTILGIAEKTVKSRLFAARRRLRELLADLRPA
ncbi:MAG: sigma-70 family RNA polymerase sigma factor [Burkholderiales bacterium]|nr:sigma-70 family RNA polymerase sigma factor [Burkholderiales bacterium]